MNPRDVEERVRSICLSLPEATERLSHGSPAFYVTKQFVMLWLDGHHDHDFPQLWCAAASGVQSMLIAEAPRRFFRPPYVGARGWIGVRLCGALDYDEMEMLCEDAYRAVANARQIALLGERGVSTGCWPDSPCSRPGTTPRESVR